MFGGFSKVPHKPNEPQKPLGILQTPTAAPGLQQKPLGVVPSNGAVPAAPRGRQGPLGVIPSPGQVSFPPDAPGGHLNASQVEAEWTGIFHGWSGYAKAGREILKRAAVFSRIRISDDSQWDPKEPIPEIQALYKFHRSLTVTPQAPKITFLPPFKQTQSGYRVIYTMMETEKCHRDLIALMNEQFDECWVPTEWNYGTFYSSGLKIPVYVIPLGVDPGIYSPSVKPALPKARLMTGRDAGKYEQPSGFLFINVFHPTFRKGYDVLIKTFEETFKDDPEAGLILGTTAYSLPDEFPWKTMKSRIWALQSTYTEKQLATIYKACKVYVSTSRGEGWNLPLCLVKGTEVDTLNGPTPIQCITSGTVVTDHNGQDALVEGVTRREYEGEVVSLKRYGDTKTIISDPLHPHLILKRPFKGFGPSLKAIQRGDVKPQWIKAGEVSKGDFMCVPKLSALTKEPPTPLVIKSFIERAVENSAGHVSLPGSYRIDGQVTLKTVADKLGVGFKHVSKILCGRGLNGYGNPYSKEHVAHVVQVAEDLGYRTPKPVTVRNVISMTEEVAFFFGLYIAEGCPLDKTAGLNITLHAKETWAADLCVRVLLNEFGVQATRKDYTNKIIIKASSRILGEVFDALFGTGAKNKHIPTEWKRLDWVRQVVSGIFYGDGCYHRVGASKYSFSTSSKRLFGDLLEIMNRCGIMATPSFGRDGEITIHIPAQYDVQFYREFSPRKYYARCLPRNKARYTHVPEDGSYFYPIIRSSTTSEFKGTLWNLHVSHGNSFTIRGTATHNCEAAAVGLPVIVPKTTAHPELVPQGMGYFFDKDSDRVFPEGRSLSPYFDGISFADYGEKSQRQLSELMLHAKKNYREAQEKAQKLRAHMVSKYTWANTARKVADRIRAICEG